MALFHKIAVTRADSLWGWNQTTNHFLEDMFPLPHETSFVSNACGGGYFSDGDTYGFVCPHMMMFSDDMILASTYDKLQKDFFYATAGSNSDNDCGKCFQVEVMNQERGDEGTTRHRPSHHLIIQVINSGGDVGYRQFDLFVGAGGMGVYTACNADCHSRYCNGGPCHENLFTGSFSDWTNSEFSTNGNACYNGGVKWFPPYNETLLSILCSNLYDPREKNLFKNQQLYKSCFLSNKYFYHQNFGSYRSTRVQCPEGLYKLTGLKRQDEEGLPRIDRSRTHWEDTCKGPACITTMCDCCKPSCAWNGKGNPSMEWPSVYTCDRLGFPF